MEIAKPGVPYASIAASTRASRPGGGAAKALVESSSAAAKAANRVSFGLADIMASWIGSLGAVVSSAARPPGRGIRRDRKSVVEGKSVDVWVSIVGRRMRQK